MNFRVVIPARYGSTRLPGKPLLDIGGKPMLQHVYECALESGAISVVIATDDERIRERMEKVGAPVCMTAAHHRSGSERLAEVIDTLGYDDGEIVVNLQGDEPMMPAVLLRQVARNLLLHATADMATLCTPIHEVTDLFDPSVVKVVTNREGLALYFSRAVIPWDRDTFSESTEALPKNVTYYRHLGLYAYRVGYLRRYVDLATCELERVESLEQLRVLWHGGAIHVDAAEMLPGPGIDTPDDLERVRALITGT
jgi:3-deoxy-manno-octulosonate cytidylyltransferase (CMP-KDO synthetase)